MAAVRKARDIEISLSKKGFIMSKSHHKFYILYVNGKKTSIKTKISHGKKEYDEQLLQSMTKQLKLSRKLLDDLLDCPLKLEDYVSILLEGGYVRL